MSRMMGAITVLSAIVYYCGAKFDLLLSGGEDRRIFSDDFSMTTRRAYLAERLAPVKL